MGLPEKEGFKLPILMAAWRFGHAVAAPGGARHAVLVLLAGNRYGHGAVFVVALVAGEGAVLVYHGRARGITLAQAGFALLVLVGFPSAGGKGEEGEQ